MNNQKCYHDFQFIECFGFFCTKCDIGYGELCLHPECDVYRCTKHSLIYPAFSEGTFVTVNEYMNDEIYVLNLGHDGIIDGPLEDVHKVLSYPGLKIVEFCGYYTSKDIVNIFDNERYNHITFTPIY